MQTSTTAELIDFAEAAGPFMEPAPGRILRVTDRYVLSADLGHTWAAVERIRLSEDEVAAALTEVDGFMHESGTKRASWWLTERSAPDEERFLAAGLQRDETDYLHAAMVLTTEPPSADEIEVRKVATLDEGGRTRSVGGGGPPRDTGARRRRWADVAADPGAARLRAGAPVPSARVRTLRPVTKETCPRCSAEMEWRHGTFQCPKCRLKIGCCEGETGDCRDPG